MKGAKYSQSPHRYSTLSKHGKNLFLLPYMLDEADLTSITGLRPPIFWQLCDRLYSAGARDRRKISLAAQVLLYRMILRQGTSMAFLKSMFALSTGHIGKIFKSLAVRHYHIGNQIPRAWTHTDADNIILDNIFDAIMSRVDPLYMHILRFFRDPSGRCRKPFVICLDSTKLQFDKTSTISLE